MSWKEENLAEGRGKKNDEQKYNNFAYAQICLNLDDVYFNGLCETARNY